MGSGGLRVPSSFLPTARCRTRLACEPQAGGQGRGPERRANDPDVGSVRVGADEDESGELRERGGGGGKMRAAVAVAARSGGSGPATREGRAGATVRENASTKRRVSCWRSRLVASM